MHNQKILTRCLLCGFAWVLALIFATFFFMSDARIDMPAETTWALEGSMYEAEETQRRVLSITLPEAFDDPLSLLFKTTHTNVSVTAGRENIYSFGEGKPSFMDSPGAAWHIVDVPADSAGEVLTIYISAVFKDYYGNDPVIRYGSRAGCAMELLCNSLPIVIINCIILFVGVVCLLLHFMGWLRKNRMAKNSFLFVGLFALSIATWSLCQSGFLQFLFPDGPTLNLIDFFSFYLFPITFNLFVASITNKRSEIVFSFLSAGYLMEMTLFGALQVLGIADLFATLTYGHMLMAVNAFCVFYFVHDEIYREKNQMMMKFRIPLYVLISFGVAELVTYYLNGLRKTSYFLPIGTIIFIIMLASQLIAQYFKAQLEEEKMAYFKKLANTDMLTEVFNRNAYEDTLRDLENKEMQLRTTCVVMFDINNMKGINDCYGHECGDIALKACCRCILTSFGENGRCFRVGGDEFVYLCNGREDIAQCAARFGEQVRKEAQALDFPFRVAIGYACYEEETDRSLRDVMRRSDEMMYRNKELQKRFDDPFVRQDENAVHAEGANA